MKYITGIIFLITFGSSYCQSVDGDAIRQHAFDFGRFDTIDSRVVDIFRNQKLILVGEMHGTTEPSRFVNYLVQNLFGKGRKICVGFEISPQEMLSSEDLYDSTALSMCPFFNDQFSGKASTAWFDLIRNVSRLTDVELFYFDLNKKQIKNASQRDSMMFFNIKTKMLTDTEAIYICITGNAHNRLSDQVFPIPMAQYFLKDKQLNLDLNNMVCFNQEYVEGAGNFNTGDGMRLHNLKTSDKFYTYTGMRNYFAFTHQLIDNYYNGVLFTYHVTAAFGVH
jgi:hypothetical protein